MLRMIAGLTAPTSGALTYDGRPVVSPRRDVAVVFQDYANALLPWRTAAGNVSLVLEAEGVPRMASGPAGLRNCWRAWV